MVYVGCSAQSSHFNYFTLKPEKKTKKTFSKKVRFFQLWSKHLYGNKIFISFCTNGQAYVTDLCLSSACPLSSVMHVLWLNGASYQKTKQVNRVTNGQVVPSTSAHFCKWGY